jgi:hypothetical protein
LVPLVGLLKVLWGWLLCLLRRPCLRCAVLCFTALLLCRALSLLLQCSVALNLASTQLLLLH